MSVKTLLYASHNAGKVEEMRALLAPFGVSVLSSRDLGLGEPEETENSFSGNARLKAMAALAGSGLPALADDSGLCVAALGGSPGVYTANWAETEAGRDFGHAMTRTHDALVAAHASEPWLAEFVCVLAYAEPNTPCAFFEGRVIGRLVWPIRGELGHGYDPMFLPDGEDRTFAQMDLNEKNSISHRGRALAAFVAGRFT